PNAIVNSARRSATGAASGIVADDACFATVRGKGSSRRYRCSIAAISIGGTTRTYCVVYHLSSGDRKDAATSAASPATAAARSAQAAAGTCTKKKEMRYATPHDRQRPRPSSAHVNGLNDARRGLPLATHRLRAESSEPTKHQYAAPFATNATPFVMAWPI